VATKQEIAESLTVNELREFAEQQGIDLTGYTVKADIVERVASGSTAAALSAYAFEVVPEEEQMEGSKEGTSESTTAVLTPQQQAEQGVSAADLEISQAPPGTGEPRIVKANPEAPTQAAMDAAQVEVTGPPETIVTVDGDEVALRPDQAAAIAPEPVHPGNAQEGYWSNPANADWQSDEAAVKAYEEAYAARIVPAE
jgi:hypothetical protein